MYDSISEYKNLEEKIMELSKGKRNFLVVLISFMVGIIYFIPYIRFTFYDQTIAAFQLTNMELLSEQRR